MLKIPRSFKTGDIIKNGKNEHMFILGFKPVGIELIRKPLYKLYYLEYPDEIHFISVETIDQYCGLVSRNVKET